MPPPKRLAVGSVHVAKRAVRIEKRQVRGFDFPICSGPEKIRHAEAGICRANKAQHLYLPVIQLYFHIPPFVYTNRRKSKHL